MIGRRSAAEVLLASLAVAGFAVAGGPPTLTNIVVGHDAVWLAWTAVTDLYIVAESPSLVTGRFHYAGAVLSTPWGTVTNAAPSAFFRVRTVSVVEFPDPGLRTAVSNALPFKYAPSDRIYDVDVEAVRTLAASPSVPITNPAGVEAMAALTNLDLSHNNLTDLNVSPLADLRTLDCSDNRLASLDVLGCARLQFLDCSWRNELTGLDVSGCPSLRVLNCAWNLLPALDVSACASLVYLDVFWNRLSALDAAACPGLEYLNCGWNGLSDLDVSACVRLATLDCSWNSLPALDVSACTNLTYVDCSYNQLTDLSSFVTNAARGGLRGADVYLSGNPLSLWAQTNQIPTLTNTYGVVVYWP